MAIYDTKIVGKNPVADGTMEFLLEKPAALKYRAGQFFDIILAAKPGAEKSSHVHGFSFASAPYEPNLVAATRMRGTPFKNTIRDLPIGTPVQIDAVFGSFTLHKDVKVPAVFIIGGVGITPVRSIIAQSSHDQSGHALTLIYANDTPARAPYVNDLKGFAKANPNFHFVQTFTQAPGAAGDEHGRVDAAMIKRHVQDIMAPIYYLSGPAGMVRATRETLMGMGVDEDNIRTEEFEGY